MPILLLFAVAGALLAQDTSAPPEIRSFAQRFWISGQANFIRQSHDAFFAKYSGPNSLYAGKEHATSRVLTLYTGFRITDRLEILADVESAGGAGISNALGLAGFTNVDVVRNPTLGSAPYLARAMLHYTLPLSKEIEEMSPGPFALAKHAAVRRLEFRVGKLSAADYFDNNAVGSDSHTQFMNWTDINNGAWDYAADTRGYTFGLVVEYDDKFGAVRFGELLMPTVANGIDLDWNIARARGENFEGEWHRKFIGEHDTVVRTLAYINHANMGNYRQSVDRYLGGEDVVPSIFATRKQGRLKYGFGLNIEQPLGSEWRTFGRLGWSDGHNESFAYTEVDRTAVVGLDVAGRRWRRAADKLGADYVTNAIVGDHRRYLALGGLGFLLGDGGLTYGTERIFEIYYTAHIWRGISVAFDAQHVENPGYNRDRGPLWVPGIRIHVEDVVPFH